jgi:hypothetical protein
MRKFSQFERNKVLKSQALARTFRWKEDKALIEPAPFSIKTTVPLYKDKLYLVVAKDPVEKFKKMQKSIFKELEVDSFYALSCYVRDTHAIFLPFGVDFNTVVHECFHTTMHLLHYRVAPFDINNHENYAYLHGWLVDWVVGQLKKRNVL